MCILLLTTSHPSYPLILLSNRDEFLSRPTAPADWWSGDPKTDSGNGKDSEDRVAEILSGRDLRHPSKGTWLGVSRRGRVACLTNFREESEDTSTATHNGNIAAEGAKRETEEGKGNLHPVAASNDTTSLAASRGKHEVIRSRGEITKHFLTSTLPPSEWAANFISEQESGKWGDMGGFSLFFGQVTPTTSGEGSTNGVKVHLTLGILSNRTKKVEEIVWLAGARNSEKDNSEEAQTEPTNEHMQRDEDDFSMNGADKGKTHGFTCSLSNSHFGDRAWPKVVRGESLLHSLVTSSTTPINPSQQPAASSAAAQEKDLVERCFAILSTDTMPARQPDEDWSSYSRKLRQSILIPPIQAGEDTYGTQKSTVILVSREGRVRYVERTLFNERAERVDGSREVEFNVEVGLCGIYVPGAVRGAAREVDVSCLWKIF